MKKKYTQLNLQAFSKVMRDGEFVAFNKHETERTTLLLRELLEDNNVIRVSIHKVGDRCVCGENVLKVEDDGKWNWEATSEDSADTKE